MIVRKLKDAERSARSISGPGWRSVRLLLKEDKMGFSFHITTIESGAELELHYQNHLESVYCISGNGEIEDRASGEVHVIEPGTIYALDQHDRHWLRAESEMTVACVFTPPLIGNEVHNSDGSYDLTADRVSEQAVAR